MPLTSLLQGMEDCKTAPCQSVGLAPCLSKQDGKTAYMVCYFNWRALGKPEFEGSLHMSLEASHGFMKM